VRNRVEHCNAGEEYRKRKQKVKETKRNTNIEGTSEFVPLSK
jgi:hypothetical protein